VRSREIEATRPRPRRARPQGSRRPRRRAR
jgi:hypothetical protein